MTCGKAQQNIMCWRAFHGREALLSKRVQLSAAVWQRRGPGLLLNRSFAHPLLLNKAHFFPQWIWGTKQPAPAGSAVFLCLVEG